MDIAQLDGRIPEEFVLGTTPDISVYALFDWYEYVYYWNPIAAFYNEKKCIGRWIGVAEVSTDIMACFVLTDTGKVVVFNYVWGLSNGEQQLDITKAATRKLDKAMAAKVGESILNTEIDSDLVDDLPEIPDTLFTDDNDEDNATRIETEATFEDANEYSTPEAYDEYLTAEVLLLQGGENKKEIVKKRKSVPDGLPMGVRNNNPLLDSREYEVEFPDGATETFTANLIAENMMSQVDADGYSYSILSAIVDHR